MTSIENRIIDKINQEIGSDINNLHKSKSLAQQFQQDILAIESKVDKIKY